MLSVCSVTVQQIQAGARSHTNGVKSHTVWLSTPGVAIPNPRQEKKSHYAFITQ